MIAWEQKTAGLKEEDAAALMEFLPERWAGRAFSLLLIFLTAEELENGLMEKAVPRDSLGRAVPVFNEPRSADRLDSTLII